MFQVRVVFVIPPLVVGWMPFVMPYFENTFGRKVMMTLSLTLCGVPLLATLFVAKGYFWVIIVLAYIGQLGCAMAFDVAYSYTRELFPTSLRSSTMGFGSGAARVGSVASSTIALLEEVLTLIILVWNVLKCTHVFLTTLTPEGESLAPGDHLRTILIGRGRRLRVHLAGDQEPQLTGLFGRGGEGGEDAELLAPLL